MELSLKGRVAVVTGGGKGVGAGITRQLAAEGVMVMITYNSNIKMAENHAQTLRDAGGIAEIIKVDVKDRAQVDGMMRHTETVFGGIDILVNNAGWQSNLDIDEYTEQQYDEIMRTNLGGYYRCMQSAIPYLKKSDMGRIIMISSVHGKRPTDFDVCYSMTKGGIKMLAREAAVELAKYGITVNTILPGAVKIEFKSGYSAIIKRNSIHRERNYTLEPLGRIPIGRMCVPDDVGKLVVFLASSAGEYLTGASIRLDGGSMLI